MLVSSQYEKWISFDRRALNVEIARLSWKSKGWKTLCIHTFRIVWGGGVSFILSFFKNYETMNIHTKFSFLAQHCTSFHAVSTKMMTYPCVWIDVFISYSKNNEYHSHSYFHILQPNWKKCSKDVPKKKKQLRKIHIKTSKMWSELYTKVELQGWYHF